MVSINKKVASVAAAGAAAAAIGLGVSQVARADDATTTTTPTPSATSTQGDPNQGTTDSTPGNGRGWGPGGRHGGGLGPGMGMGKGMGKGADLAALATTLGVDQTKARGRPQGRAGRGEGRPHSRAGRCDEARPGDDAGRAWRRCSRASLGIDAAKVKAAFADLRAAHEADEQKAFDDRLAQAVKDGTLTQAEADAVEKAAKAGVIDMHGGPR